MKKKKTVAARRTSKTVDEKKSRSKNSSIEFKTAFMYPFNRPKGILNILWLLIPIFGWFAVGGYVIKIVQGFSRGEFKELPLFNFMENMKLGFFMFLKAIPFWIVYALVISGFDVIGPLGGLLEFLVGLFIVPLLAINFMKKETVKSFFEFEIVKKVFNNLGEYLIAFLKDLGLSLIFLVMILVIVGVPALVFTHYIFFADFYRRYVK